MPDRTGRGLAKMTTLSSWAQYVDLLKPAEKLIDELAGGPSAEQRRADLYRQFAMNLAQGYFLYFQSTPEHPVRELGLSRATQSGCRLLLRASRR